MFRATWSWLVPLLSAVAVFSGVLVTTPPGFAAVPQALFVAARGPATDAAAYALGAAAAFGLLTLVVLAAICAVAELILNRYQ